MNIWELQTKLRKNCVMVRSSDNLGVLQVGAIKYEREYHGDFIVVGKKMWLTWSHEVFNYHGLGYLK